MKPNWKPATTDLLGSDMELAHFEKLADELIELRCGTHSLGNFYEYLLKAYGDTNKAKADFIRLLSGDLPTRALQTAAEWISEEQEYDCREQEPVIAVRVGAEIAVPE